jgi:hypothetical protein
MAITPKNQLEGSLGSIDYSDPSLILPPRQGGFIGKVKLPFEKLIASMNYKKRSMRRKEALNSKPKSMYTKLQEPTQGLVNITSLSVVGATREIVDKAKDKAQNMILEASQACAAADKKVLTAKTETCKQVDDLRGQLEQSIDVGLTIAEAIEKLNSPDDALDRSLLKQMADRVLQEQEDLKNQINELQSEHDEEIEILEEESNSLKRKFSQICEQARDIEFAANIEADLEAGNRFMRLVDEVLPENQRSCDMQEQVNRIHAGLVGVKRANPALVKAEREREDMKLILEEIRRKQETVLPVDHHYAEPRFGKVRSKGIDCDARLTYYLKIKFAFHDRTPSLLTMMRTEARLWMSGRGLSLDTQEEFDMLTTSVLAAYIPSHNEMALVDVLTDRAVFSDISLFNKTLRGEIDVKVNSRLFGPKWTGVKQSLLFPSNKTVKLENKPLV